MSKKQSHLQHDDRDKEPPIVRDIGDQDGNGHREQRGRRIYPGIVEPAITVGHRNRICHWSAEVIKYDPAYFFSRPSSFSLSGMYLSVTKSRPYFASACCSAFLFSFSMVSISSFQ